MKRVGRVLVAVSACLSVLSGHVIAQTLPPQVKQAPSVDQASRQAIELAISQNIKKLSDANPVVQREGREALVSELRLPGGEPSAAFLAAYSEALGNAVMKLPEDTPVLTLLNAAIAVQRVAEVTKSTRLEGVIGWMLAPERPEAVGLWGMKAARPVMPELVKLRQHKKLVSQIVPAVKANPSGAMTAEAYGVLQVSDPLVVDALLDLVLLRASLYQGPEAPEDPHVDYDPFASFLSVRQWGVMTPPQKVRTLQAICHLMVLSARHGDAAAPNTLPHEQLQSLFQQMGKALQAIGLQLGNAELQSVGANASRAQPMSPAAKLVCPAIKKIPGFEGVKEPSVGNEGGAEAPAER